MKLEVLYTNFSYKIEFFGLHIVKPVYVGPSHLVAINDYETIIASDNLAIIELLLRLNGDYDSHYNWVLFSYSGRLDPTNRRKLLYYRKFQRPKRKVKKVAVKGSVKYWKLLMGDVPNPHQ